MSGFAAAARRPPAIGAEAGWSIGQIVGRIRSQIGAYAGLQGWPVPDIFGRSAESIDALQSDQRLKHARSARA